MSSLKQLEQFFTRFYMGSSVERMLQFFKWFCEQDGYGKTLKKLLLKN